MMAQLALKFICKTASRNGQLVFPMAVIPGRFQAQTVDSKSAIDGLAGFFGSGILMAHRAPAKGATEGHGVFVKTLLASFREAS